MSTSAGIKQFSMLDDKLGNPSAAKMHRIIADGGDLFGMMAEADLSLVDRQAFQQLLFPAGKLTIPWTPVGEYADKIRVWNQARGWGLTEKHIGALERKLQATPHAGDLLPTSVTLSLGKGVSYDWREAMACLKVELRNLLGTGYWGFGERVSPELLQSFSGSEPKRGLYAAPAKLDLQEFYSANMRVDAIRTPDRKWPGTEVPWLLALNPQIVEMMTSVQIPQLGRIPALIAAGLCAGGQRSIPVVASGGTVGRASYSEVNLYHTVVSFRS